jgi:hypothetical protein
MINFEQEWLASERVRERLHEAAHERLARQVRRPATRPSDGRRLHWRAAFALVRRLTRAPGAV